MLTLSPGTNVLCEVALGVGSSSVLLGEGQQKPGSGTCAGDGPVLQGQAEPLPPLPPGRCTPPPPAAEVTCRSTGAGLSRAWGLEGGGQHGRGEAGVIILDHSLLDGEVIVAFGASVEHPNISHRPQRSVPEEFSAPLELSQPLSDLVDGRISHPSPFLPSLP